MTLDFALNNSMISKEEYLDKKAYYDYQRKIAYNKEVIFYMADRFQNRVYNGTICFVIFSK